MFIFLEIVKSSRLRERREGGGEVFELENDIKAIKYISIPSYRSLLLILSDYVSIRRRFIDLMSVYD